jgi:hypothetical protein
MSMQGDTLLEALNRGAHQSEPPVTLLQRRGRVQQHRAAQEHVGQKAR